jgi:hypothetical protein
MSERMSREERDDLDRAHGQHLLDVMDYASSASQQRGEDPLVVVLRQAHQARASESSAEAEDNQQ